MNFADRYGPWAVVAGASEGTGRSFARKIAARGVPSVLIGRRREPLVALADQIRAETGVACVAASVDLAAPDATEKLVAAVGQRDIGLFVSNAGADPNGSRFLDRNVKDWIDLVQRNVMTTMLCCHHFGGLMRKRGKGGILLVNSGACYLGGSFLATYSASKAFVLNFGEGLWVELRPHGVDVLNLVLGRTDTPAFRALMAEKGIPFPTDVASPDEVVEAGLTHLPDGPVFNWTEVAPHAPIQPEALRERILMVDQMSRSVFGDA
jgi:short-subunit dehydrogenase